MRAWAGYLRMWDQRSEQRSQEKRLSSWLHRFQNQAGTSYIACAFPIAPFDRDLADQACRRRPNDRKVFRADQLTSWNQVVEKSRQD